MTNRKSSHRIHSRSLCGHRRRRDSGCIDSCGIHTCGSSWHGTEALMTNNFRPQPQIHHKITELLMCYLRIPAAFYREHAGDRTVSFHVSLPLLVQPLPACAAVEEPFLHY